MHVSDIALHSKGSTCCGNSDGISHSIISRSGLQIFVYIKHILSKLCCETNGGAVVMMEHHVQADRLDMLGVVQCEGYEQFMEPRQQLFIL